MLVDLAWADTWLANPAPVPVLATGIAMVIKSGAWEFSQTWVYLSLGPVVVYEVIAGTVGGRLYRQIESARQAGTVPSSAYGMVLPRFQRLGTLMLVLLVVIVVLMVLKPGI